MIDLKLRPLTLKCEALPEEVRAGQAARTVTAHAHQIQGSIGFTREFSLQLWTRRLWAWREKFGNEPYWALELGALLVGCGADALWTHLAKQQQKITGT